MYLLNSDISNQIILTQDDSNQILAKAEEIILKPTEYDDQVLIENWAIIALSYSCKKDLKKTEKAFLEIINLIKKLDNKLLLGKGFSDFGDILYLSKDYSKAIEYYLQCLDIFKNLKEFESYLKTLSQLAYCYHFLEDDVKEEHFLELGISELNIDILTKAFFLERIGFLWEKRGNPKKAMGLLEESLNLFKTENFSRNWEERVKKLANIYMKTRNKTKAQRILNEIQEPDIVELLANLTAQSEQIRMSTILTIVEKPEISKTDLYTILQKIIVTDPSNRVKELAQICLDDLNK